MKLAICISFLIIAAFATVQASSVIHDAELDIRFRAWLHKFEKSTAYSTSEEYKKRRAIFADNLARAAEQQKRDPSARYGETKFSDLTAEEFKAKHLHGYKKAAKKTFATEVPAPRLSKSELSATPNSFDWRPKGAVTPIKNQGNCGSCWAFSTVENIESQWFLAGNKLEKLSPQEIVSCDNNDDGCGGGDTGSAMEWLVQNQDGWITSEKAYPYQCVNGCGQLNCDLPKPKAARIYGNHLLPSDESQMAAYLAIHGPLSICLDASSWQNYQGGVMENCYAGQVDHCVGIVGYTDLNGTKPYWVVRNSWGTNWGYEGYLHVGYGSNQCNINSEPRNALIHHAGPTPPPTPSPPTPSPAPPTPMPPVPPTTPSPPADKKDWKLRRCNSSDETCSSSGCTDYTMKQDTCYPRPGHTGQSIKGKCTAGSATMTEQVWHHSADCSGIWSEEIQWPVLICMLDNTGGDWKKFECPPFHN